MEILNVTTSILQLLREKIITCELKPGQKLNESNLSKSFGISRPPLREAFRVLEKDNMVVNVPRKGTYVTELSSKNYTEVSQVREMIECYTIELLKSLSIRNLPKVTMALSRASSLSMPLDSTDPKKLLGYEKVFLDFHKNLVESSENTLLISIYNAISINLARYQFIYFYIDGTTKHSLEDHYRILEFITNGDYDQAKEELKKHINYTIELVKSELVKSRILDPAIF